MSLIKKILSGTITLAEVSSQGFKDEIAALVQRKTLPITRKLSMLQLIKTIDVPAFKATKKFYTEGWTNSYGMRMVFQNEKFKTEIIPHIPEILDYAGGKEDSFQWPIGMLDYTIMKELGNPKPISIEDWAKKTASIIINCTADMKTDGHWNAQFVKAIDGRTLMVCMWFHNNSWNFNCGGVGGDIVHYAGHIVFSPAVVEFKKL